MTNRTILNLIYSLQISHTTFFKIKDIAFKKKYILQKFILKLVINKFLCFIIFLDVLPLTFKN